MRVKSMEKKKMNISPTTGLANMSRPFPKGLRVLVVDDNQATLEMLEEMLRQCSYEVTKCYRADTALSLLRENKNGFDVVLSDVHMPDMDGFEFLEHIGLEMDLPVIMMSEDEDTNAVMKGVIHGACDYLLKPVSIQALKNIWQHVVRKKSREWKDLEQSGCAEDEEQRAKHSEIAENASSGNNESSVWKNNTKRRKDEEDEAEDKDETSALKKPRVVWSYELHQQFVDAVNEIGIDKAVPKKILELMNIPGLSRENVASHLQKYRLFLRRVMSRTSQQSEVDRGQDATFDSMSSINGLDLDTNAISSQLKGQSLDGRQGERIRTTVKSSLPTQTLDHRNLYGVENSKVLYLEEHLLPQMSKSICNDPDLLPIISPTLDTKQLTNMIQPTESFGPTSSHGVMKNSFLTPQSSGLMMNGDTARRASLLGSLVGQPIVSNEIIGVMQVSNGMLKNEQCMTFDAAAQESSMVSFHTDHNVELPDNSLPLWNPPRLSQDDSDSESMVSRSMSYDTLNELNQPKSQDWELRLETFDSPHPATPIDLLPSLIVQQQNICNATLEQLGNIYLDGKTIYSSSSEENQHLSAQNLSQLLYPECFFQPDAINTILQQQACTGLLNFDEDPVGN